jgi:hypothetical protein
MGALVRVAGIEPAFQAWEARILPLNYTRKLAAEAKIRAAFCEIKVILRS